MTNLTAEIQVQISHVVFAHSPLSKPAEEDINISILGAHIVPLIRIIPPTAVILAGRIFSLRRTMQLLAKQVKRGSPKFV